MSFARGAFCILRLVFNDVAKKRHDSAKIRLFCCIIKTSLRMMDENSHLKYPVGLLRGILGRLNMRF